MLSFLKAFSFTLVDEIPTDLHSKWAPLPSIGTLGLESGMSLRAIISQEYLCSLDIPLAFQLLHIGTGPAIFTFLCPSYESRCGFFPKSLAIRLLLS